MLSVGDEDVPAPVYPCHPTSLLESETSVCQTPNLGSRL